MMTMLPSTPILGETLSSVPMPSNQGSGNQVNDLGEATSPFDLSALPTPEMESDELQQPRNFMTFHEVMASNIPSAGSSLYGQSPSDLSPSSLSPSDPSSSGLPPSGSSLAGLPSAYSPAGIPDPSYSQIVHSGTEPDPPATLSQNGMSLSQNNMDTSAEVPGYHAGSASATSSMGPHTAIDRSVADTSSQHPPTASQHDMNSVAGAAGGNAGGAGLDASAGGSTGAGVQTGSNAGDAGAGKGQAGKGSASDTNTGNAGVGGANVGKDQAGVSATEASGSQASGSGTKRDGSSGASKESGNVGGAHEAAGGQGRTGSASATSSMGPHTAIDRSVSDTASQHSHVASQHDMNSVAGAAGSNAGGAGAGKGQAGKGSASGTNTGNAGVGGANVGKDQAGVSATEASGNARNVGSQDAPSSISTSGNQAGGNVGQSSAGSGWADANSANSSGSSGQSHTHVGNSSNSGQPAPQGAQMTVATLDALLGSLAESAGYVGDAVVTVSPDATPAQVAAEIVSVLVPLQSSGNGAGSVTIRLDPPGMGSISAMVEASASGLSVHFQTDNVHAHELLNQVLQDIKEHLSSGTSGTVNVTISWGGGSGSMTGHGSHGMSSGSGHRSGVGGSTEADATSDGVLPESTTSNGSTTKRLLDVRL